LRSQVGEILESDGGLAFTAEMVAEAVPSQTQAEMGLADALNRLDGVGRAWG
jgi:hypothetical protein